MITFTPEPPVPSPRERGRANRAQGTWGERAAARYLEDMGWRVVARNVRPVAKDRRCEIDLVVRSRARPLVAFVEVKTHKRFTTRATRLRAITRTKMRTLLRAFAAWLSAERWNGNYRFDVVEVYGWKDDGVPPEIDHIENVPIFPPRWRFRSYG